MAKTFARERRPVRLLPIVTESADLGASLLRDGKADLAVVRSDELPATAQAIAVLLKNVLVLSAPPARGARERRKGAPPKITSIEQLAGRKVGLLGHAPANVPLLDPVLSMSGVAPEKVEIIPFSTADAAKMAADPALDAFATVGPTDSRITTDAISATARVARRTEFCRSRLPKRWPRSIPQYESAEIHRALWFVSAPA